MADEPSDVGSCTDEDGVKGSWNNKRKSTQACSYPNKKDGSFIIRNKRECFVICVFAVVVLIFIYLFTGEEDEEDHEEDTKEEGEVAEGDRNLKEEAEDEEEDEEECHNEDDEDEDEQAHVDLFKAVVDCFIATKAWAKHELGLGNTNIEEILGMLRFVPGYDEAVKAKQEATKAKRHLEFL